MISHSKNEKSQCSKIHKNVQFRTNCTVFDLTVSNCEFQNYEKPVQQSLGKQNRFFIDFEIVDLQKHEYDIFGNLLQLKCHHQ